MLKLIRGWSPRVEAAIVILGAFGYPAVMTVLAVAGLVTTDFSLIKVSMMGLYELAALAVVSAFLYVRGWDIKRFGLKPERPDPLIALGLAGLFFVLLLFLGSLAAALHLLANDADTTSKLQLDSMLVVVLMVFLCFIEAAFEELFLCGYLISFAKEHRRLALGVNAALLIRIGTNADEGVIGVLLAIAFGAVFTAWYVKTGRLWPAILAHAFINLFFVATA